MDDPSAQANRKTVLLLDDIYLPSIEDWVIAFGHAYQKRTFLTQPDALSDFEVDLKQLTTSEDLLAVLIFLSKSMLFETCSVEYSEIWFSLLMELKKVRAVIFIREDNFHGKFLDDDKLEHLFLKMQFLAHKLMEVQQNIDIINDIRHELEIAIELMNDCSRILLKLFQLYNDDKLSELYQYIFFNLNMFKKLLDGSKITNKITKKLYADQLQENPLLEELRVRAMQTISHLMHFQLTYQRKLAERSDKALQLLKSIQASGIEMVSYKKNVEISLWVHRFLDEMDKGIFLHLYVPNGRYQEDQLASFLRLFESYLQHVEKLHFVIDTRRTLHGQIYEFKSKNTKMNSSELEVAFSRFESFMGLCQNDQKKAEAFLLKTGLNPSEASRLMTKYVKEYQRLLLDIEHERERKMLDLRQKFESEAFELTYDTSLTVSQSVQPTALLSLPHHLDPLSITISNSSVVINPGIQSYVEQTIYGDIHYTTEDKELLHFFDRYAERLEAILLRSDLEQLKDPSSSEEERKTAKQKIAGFLSKVAPAIGQSALAVLTAYLEKVLTGS